MYSKIEFENYRIFSDRQSLRIAPITVLFGKNNVGKSAVLKLPLMINFLIENKNLEDTPDNTICGVKICDELRDLIHRKGARELMISVSDSENLGFRTSFHVDSTKSPQIQDEKFDPMIESIDDYDKFSESLKEIVSSRLCPEIEYISAIRHIPEPYFQHSASASALRSDGRIAYDRIIGDRNDGSLIREVSSWYSKVFDGWKIELDSQREPIYSLKLVNGGLRNNFTEGGAGIIQSFPVIVSASMNYPKPHLTIVEEPETHTHPEAHGEMAEFIALKVKESKGLKNFMIETHSVNFILRLRYLIATGVLNKNDLALYYIEFNPEKGCSEIKEVEIMEDGSVKNWPKDVFKETLAESLKLAKAQMKIKEV